MSYDQYLLPAGRVSTAAEAETYLAGQFDQPGSASAARLAAVLTVTCGDALSISPLQADGDVVMVPVVFPEVGPSIERVHVAGSEAGYDVYDPQVGIVFAPRAAVPGRIVTHHGAFPTLTGPAVEVLVARLEVDRFVVAGGDDEYVQTYRDGPDSFTVEFRDGDAARHFGTTVDSAGEVQRIFRAWLAGGAAALEADSGLRWERVEF